MNAKGKFQVIPMLRDMFHDLELEDNCAEVIDRFPNVVEKLTTSNKNVPNGIKMGTKSLGKGKKSNIAAIQSNYSSMHPLHPIGENREESDMEEQMPELVDISDNEISSTRDYQQGSTTENVNENGNSRNTPPPIILMTNLRNLLKK